MRTTLDIADDVLAAAKELAKARKTTAGQILSELAREALTHSAGLPNASGSQDLRLIDGWYVLPRRGGPLATNELIDRLLEQADAVDAGMDKAG